MKRAQSYTGTIRLAALAVCLCMILCGCSAAPAEGAGPLPPGSRSGLPDKETDAAEAAGTEAPAAEPALIPWGGEAPITEQAVSTASMICCFMSGEGVSISGGSSKSAFGDTKWGDSTLVVFPGGETMLIDGGMADYGPMLVKNLRALGVTRLDAVVLSHYHNDHYGGLLCAGGVLDSFEVGTVYSPEIDAGHSSVREKLAAQARQNGAGR